MWIASEAFTCADVQAYYSEITAAVGRLTSGIDGTETTVSTLCEPMTDYADVRTRGEGMVRRDGWFLDAGGPAMEGDGHRIWGEIDHRTDRYRPWEIWDPATCTFDVTRPFHSEGQDWAIRSGEAFVRMQLEGGTLTGGFISTLHGGWNGVGMAMHLQAEVCPVVRGPWLRLSSSRRDDTQQQAGPTSAPVLEGSLAQ